MNDYEFIRFKNKTEIKFAELEYKHKEDIKRLQEEFEQTIGGILLMFIIIFFIILLIVIL